jgi:hypothetical protein
MADPNQLAPPVALFHLTIDQARRHPPPAHVAPSPTHLEPLSKMSCQGVEVEIEPIAGEEGHAARGQDVSQGVDDAMRSVLRAGTQMEDGKQLRRGVDDQPQPQDAGMAAEPCSQFIQLQMREVQMGEEAHVQGVCVLACTSQPGGDGGLSKAEDPFGGGSVQPFGQRREHHGDLVRGSFQAVQRRVAPGSERGAASLATKRLDLFSAAMFAIPNERMEGSVGVAEVHALRVGTSKPLGAYALGGSPSAFHLSPGTYRSKRRPCTQGGSGGETTDRAIVWGAWLEQTGERRAHLGCCSRPDRTMMGPAKGTKQRQKEDEKEQEQKHMDVHEAFSLPEMSRRDRFLLEKEE